MSYRVKEVFYSLQGEGALTGRAAVFCRFAGCNLWSGKVEDRHQSPCVFCDTDFNGTNGEGGGVYESASALLDVISSTYAGDRAQARPLVILTGGEPLLQADAPLLEGLRRKGFFTAVETNGTVAAPAGLDWITVSPKAGTRVIQKSGSELKVVFPQERLAMAEFEGWTFEHRFVQPCYSPDEETSRKHVAEAVRFCLQNPAWRLSLQTHRLIGMK